MDVVIILNTVEGFLRGTSISFHIESNSFQHSPFSTLCSQLSKYTVPLNEKCESNVYYKVSYFFLLHEIGLHKVVYIAKKVSLS